MRILKLTSLLMVAVLATAVLFTSCVKKPKLDLSGVQGNPGGNGAGEAGELGELANGGLDGVGDEGFVPGGEPGFDGVVDFDAALRDPKQPESLPADITRDHLHPNDEGYRRMADSIDLAMLGCTAR